MVKHIWSGWFAVVALSAACASTPPHKPEERAAARVATAAVEVTDLPSVFEAGGIVRAKVTALVASRVLAPIAAVHVRAGDRVRRGDVLVTLDARDLRANQSRADAMTRSAVESVRAAEADVRATEASVQLARVTHERIAALQSKRSATVEELDQATAALRSSEAQQAAAQARLAAATAGRDAAKAAADAAAVTATYATLAAPFDGIVTERTAEPGSMATPGAPLLTLEDPATYRVEARLDETRAALVAPNAPAEVQLDSSDTTLTGRVVEIARIDPMSHSFLVKIELPAGALARFGQFGRASFRGPSRRALTVPSSVLIRRGQLTFVFVADAEGHVRLRPVSTGAAGADRVEVIAGLREGDCVVLSPPPGLADGDGIAGARP